MAQRQFRLPDLGEGLTDAEIVRWLARVGDTVTVNQPLVEVETAKAVVEIPSPFAGVLAAIHGEAGSTLEVGAPLLTIHTAEVGDGATATGTTNSTDTGSASANGAGGAPSSLPTSRDGDSTERTPVLVGYGPRTVESRRRRPRRPISPPGPPAGPSAPSAPGSGPGSAPGPARDRGTVLAKPPVRKLARDLGVDLAAVTGTGPNGTISRTDVEAAVGAATRTAAPGPPSPGGLAPPSAPAPPATPAPPDTLATPTTPTPPSTRTASGAGAATGARPPIGAIPAAATFAPGTGTWHVPVTGIRRSMAQAMVASASSAPHVTEFLTVDVTATMAARDRVAALPEFAGVKVTPLLFVAKALLAAVRRHPMINAGWIAETAPDGGPAEIRVHQRVNLGIAVAGPRGLVVPNIPDAGALDLAGLAHALHNLATGARADRLSPADLRGGTITITNIGVFGVDIGTPILNPGEAAILALGSIRPAPWVHEGQLAVRTVAQLALSFDHRIVDGELGSAVLRDVGAMLADPTLALAWS